MISWESPSDRFDWLFQMQHVTTIDLLLSPTGDAVQVKDADLLGPFFQGVLMELIDSEYAGYLHQLPFNPYSQYVLEEESGNKLRWRVSALNDEAADQLLRVLQETSVINLRARGVALEVDGLKIEQIPLIRLTDILHEQHDSRMSVRFLTPTAFKSKGEYIIMPSPRLIFQNLLMRYEQTYSGSKEIDFETIDYLDSHTRISSYSLRSRYFTNIGGTSNKIPAFVGRMTLHFSGPQAVTGLARMLLLFGSYSGIGIKTSMGMGAVEIV